MSAKQCLSCLGVYEPITREGMPYFHACPPIVAVAVERDGKAQHVALTDLQPTDVIAVLRDGARVAIPVSDQRARDLRLDDVAIERSNKRDENPVPDIVNGKRTTRPLSVGDGIRDAPAPAAPPVLGVGRVV